MITIIFGATVLFLASCAVAIVMAGWMDRHEAQKEKKHHTALDLAG